MDFVDSFDYLTSTFIETLLFAKEVTIQDVEG